MSSFELGSIVLSKYQIQQVIAQEVLEQQYVVVEHTASQSRALLLVLRASEAGKAPLVGQQFQPEILRFQQFQHPQVQAIRHYSWDEQAIFIVLNAVEGLTYLDWVQSHNLLTETEVSQLLRQILPVLDALHRENLFHQDISPTHLKRHFDGAPVLTDFGILHEIREALGIQQPNGSLNEIHPFQQQQFTSTANADLYALAVTLLMLFTGQPAEALYDSENQVWDWERWRILNDQLTRILNQMLEQQNTSYPVNAATILQLLNPGFPSTSQVPTSTRLITPPSNKLEEERSSVLPWILGSGILLTIVGVFAIVNVTSKNGREATIAPSISIQDQPSPPQPELLIPPSDVLTEQVAVELIQAWLQAKSQVYASPFDKEQAANLTTGKFYQDITKPGGTIDWLRQNNAYYRFGNFTVRPRGKFFVSGTQAEIEVEVTEDRTLIINGRPDTNQTESGTTVIRYSLQQVADRWKIADLQVIQ